MQSAMAAFRSFVEPVFRRPAFLQAGAICVRTHKKRPPEVLLITSLTTRRWIVPKGWPMDGRTLGEAAQQEAWEEAGVVGQLDPEAIGSFQYRKIMKQGIPVTCTCQVFRIDVDHLTDDWPEKGRRERRWLSLDDACELIEEEGLRTLIQEIGKQRPFDE